ncbi:MAG: hypothetical protein AAFP90_14510 [Planctomycetota bacterium]
MSSVLQILPGTGFNGTLVDPSTADVIVRALASHREARVLSTPKILVDDNAEGQLTSVSEVPFTSVNASNTVATTSFADQAILAYRFQLDRPMESLWVCELL